MKPHDLARLLHKEQDHIGPDPIKWVQRLMDVNETSQFSADQKVTIADGLDRIIKHLNHLNQKG